MNKMLDVTLPHEIAPCGTALCDRPGIAYVSRTAFTATSGGRLLAIVGRRAEWLAHTGPAEHTGLLEVRCIDCVHHELDQLIGEAASSREEDL